MRSVFICNYFSNSIALKKPLHTPSFIDFFIEKDNDFLKTKINFYTLYYNNNTYQDKKSMCNHMLFFCLKAIY